MFNGPFPAKHRTLATKGKKYANTMNQEGTRYFIGYVPIQGKVWELGGPKSRPAGAGELPTPPPPSRSDTTARQDRVGVVWPKDEDARVWWR
jgi:hypothetical protein